MRLKAKVTTTALAILGFLGVLVLPLSATANASSTRPPKLPDRESLTALHNEVQRLAESYYQDGKRSKIPTIFLGNSSRSMLISWSSPVLWQSHYIVVVVFPYAPHGTPVKVFRLRPQGRWTIVASIPSPMRDFHGDPVFYGVSNKIPTAFRVNGLKPPSYLLKMAGGGCFSGALLSYFDRSWRFVPFLLHETSYKTVKIGGNPTFFRGYIETTTACTAVQANASQFKTFWAYSSKYGEMVVVHHYLS